MTDDRGEYRMFFVPPGEYVIRAQVQGGRPAGPVPTRPGEMQTLVSTLFPNTTDMAQAGKVIVKSGEEVRGIDISVKMQVVISRLPLPKPTGGFKISGLVVDGVLPWVGTAALLLGSEAEPGAPQVVGSVIIGGTPGAFEIPSVPPGKYDLFASMPHAERISRSRMAAYRRGDARPLKLCDHDVENVRFMIHPSVGRAGHRQD